MSPFVICVRILHLQSCHSCDNAAVWELHGSNNPNLKYAACDCHRTEAMALLAGTSIATDLPATACSPRLPVRNVVATHE